MFPSSDRSLVLCSSSVCPLNFSGTLPLLADDVAFYFTEIFKTIRQELLQVPLLSPVIFSICIRPFFTCSLNSVFTCLLRDLALGGSGVIHSPNHASITPACFLWPFPIARNHLIVSSPYDCMLPKTAVCQLSILPLICYVTGQFI